MLDGRRQYELIRAGGLKDIRIPHVFNLERWGFCGILIVVRAAAREEKRPRLTQVLPLRYPSYSLNNLTAHRQI